MKLRIIFIALFVLLMCQTVFANELPVKVKFNDDYLSDDTATKSLDGRIYVPLRPFAEAFGGTLEWSKEEEITKVYIGEDTYLFGQDVNKKRSADGDIPLETKARYVDGSLMVELKAFAALFSADLAYDKDAHTIVLTKEGAKLPKYAIGKAPRRLEYSEAEMMTLARLVHIESQGGSLERSLAVANVVLNRMKSGRFPGSIDGVVYQRGQFPPTRRATFTMLQPEANAIRAAKLALEGYNNVGECLYFNHRPFSWKDKEDLVKIIEGMYFYK